MSNMFTDKIKDDPEAQERVRAWIDALRSGRYEQGTAALRTSEGFCCLGVACDLLESSWTLYQADMAFFAWADTGAMSLLPDRAMDAYHIATESGNVDKVDGGFSLSELNDSGKSFAYIANVIERELREALK